MKYDEETNELLTKEEEQLHQMILRAQSEYEKAIKPFVDRLIQIKNMKEPPRYIIKGNE